MKSRSSSSLSKKENMPPPSAVALNQARKPAAVFVTTTERAAARALRSTATPEEEVRDLLQLNQVPEDLTSLAELDDAKVSLPGSSSASSDTLASSSSAKEADSSPDAVVVHGALDPEAATEAASPAEAATLSMSVVAEEAPCTGSFILPSIAGAILTGATVIHPQTGFPSDGESCGAMVVMVLELLVQGENPDLLKPTTPNHARAAITYSIDSKQLVTLKMLEEPLDDLHRKRTDVIWVSSRDTNRHPESWVDFHDGSKLTYKDAFRLTPEHWLSDNIINACVLLMNKYLCEHSLTNTTVVMNSFFACKAERDSRRDSFDLARWLNKAFAGVQPRRLLMPVHVGGNHWLALSLRLAEGRVIVADVWPGTGLDESFDYADVVATVVQAVQEFISSTSMLPLDAVQTMAAAIRCSICRGERPRLGEQMCDACHSTVMGSRADSAVVRTPPPVVVESSSPQWVCPLLPLEAHRLEQLRAARACCYDDVVAVEGMPTSTQNVRARVTDIESARLVEDPDFSNYVCTLRSELGVGAHVDNMVEALLYVEEMRNDHTHGDDPEVSIIAQDILAGPLVVIEVSRDSEGTPKFRRAADYKNETSTKLSAFLLRSNEDVGKPFAAHYDVLVPVVEVEHLNDPKGHGPLLQAMMSLVMVHPVVVKFEITGTPDVTLSFFLFGRGNDGACLFRSAALILQAQELIRSSTGFCTVIHRALPKLNPEETMRCAHMQAFKSCLTQIRNTSWSGDKVLESTTVNGQMKLEKLCKSIFEFGKDAVCFDLGAGHGNVSLFSGYSMVACECDPLLFIALKKMYLQLREKGCNPAVTFLYLNAINMASFDGFEVVFLYECSRGTKNGFNNEHKIIVKNLLRSDNLKAFSSTKLQTHCLEAYIEEDPEIGALLCRWTVFKIDGVSRTKSHPVTFLYVQKKFLYPTSSEPLPRRRSVLEHNGMLVENSLKNRCNSRDLWSVQLSKDGREVCSSHKELRITIGDFTLVDFLTSMVVTTGDTLFGLDQSGTVIGLACVMPYKTQSPFQVVVLDSSNPLSFKLVEQVEILKVDAGNRVQVTDDQIEACKQHFKELNGSKAVQQLRSSSRRSSRKPTLGSESDQDQKLANQQALPQETTQEMRSQEKFDRKLAKQLTTAAQEKIDGKLEQARLTLSKSTQQFKTVQKANKTAKQRLQRENKKRVGIKTKRTQRESELETEQETELSGSTAGESSDFAETPSKSLITPETPPIYRESLITPSPTIADLFASNQKMADLLAASNKKLAETLSELSKTKPVQESVNEKHIQGLLLEVTAKLDNTALSIQLAIENKSKDVKAQEKKRVREASEQKFLDMQTTFQRKISDELATQKSRSKLQKGLKKMKLLMETAKTATAEQGKRAFELEVKRLELAQEQARADALWLRGSYSKRQRSRSRSRSARFHYFCIIFVLLDNLGY